ncbi:DMT family transporter [Desulfotomaculum copahuensis]|uniref:EamA domain-containing protein n=1 Tax=Desulfotomaculum copahuensis TaxID=1838280 RepID=A0A1B7LKP1_9FIRM|nr:EamA family transporter [Desulfotomaculum copahuensis]OAT87071.1 hypothetical protein A6M21_01905 [Desulfotomaculum copahuensis]
MIKKINFALLCLIWGSTWLAIKIGLDDFPPFTFAAVRFALATLVVYGLVRWKHLTISRRWSDLKGTFWFGVFNGISYALVFFGEQFISSGLTAIINAALPFFSLIFACFLAGEKLTAAKSFGLITGFCGLLLVFSGDVLHLGRGNLAGQVAILLAAAAYAFGAVLAKRYGNGLGLLEGVTVQMGITTLVIALPAVLLEWRHALHFTMDGVLAFLYLTLVGSVAAFLLYFWLLERMEVSRLSLYSLITPVIATILGAWWAHERVLWQYGVGLVVIMLGLWIVNHPQRYRRPAVEAQSDAVPGHR